LANRGERSTRMVAAQYSGRFRIHVSPVTPVQSWWL